MSAASETTSHRPPPDWQAHAVLAIAGAVLLGAPHFWRPLWPLAWLGGVPWLMLVGRPSRREDKPVHAGWLLLASWTFVFVTCVLAVAPTGWIASNIHHLFFVPFPFAALLLVREIQRRRPAPLVVLWPAAIVTSEWASSRLALGALEFAHLSFGQAAFLPVIQVADLVTSFGVSGLVAAASGATADLLFARREAPAARRRARIGAVAFSALLALSLVYGFVRPATLAVEPGPRVALLQPNIPRRGTATARETLLFELGQVREKVKPGMADLVVLPENSLEALLDKPEFMDDVKTVLAEIRTPLVIGAFGVHPRFAGRVEEARAQGDWPYTNAAYHLDAEGRVLGVAHKIHLLPWTEYLPCGRLLRAIHPSLEKAERDLVMKLLGFGGMATPGDSPEIFTIAHHGGASRFWVPICFEVADGRLTREATRKGADFLLGITSEGRLGPQLFWQMAAINQVRAVEIRRTIARSTNTGITCVIGPDGRLRDVLRVDGMEWGVEGMLVADVPVSREGLTLAVRLGDLAPAAFAAVLLVLLVLAFVRPRGPAGQAA